MSSRPTQVIEKIALSDVIAYDRIRYNTNNIGPMPADYHAVINANNTCNWVSPIIPRTSFQIPFWMFQAAYISKQTGVCSRLFEEELDEFIRNFTQPTPLDGTTPYFIRTEHVSLKCGQHGKGPYYNLRQILESTISCIEGHNPIRSPQTTPTLTLYFMPWIDIAPHQEYRVFVYRGYITAISQQNLYSDVWRSVVGNADEILQQHLQTIVAQFPLIQNTRVTWTDTFVYDVAVLCDTNAYFIEPNSFGAAYASGSSLFEWVADKDILTPSILPPATITCRICCGEKTENIKN